MFVGKMVGTTVDERNPVNIKILKFQHFLALTPCLLDCYTSAKVRLRMLIPAAHAKMWLIASILDTLVLLVDSREGRNGSEKIAPSLDYLESKLLKGGIYRGLYRGLL